MNVSQAADDFLFALQVEKNYSPNTIQNYAHDLAVFQSFLSKNKRSHTLDDVTPSTVRRFIQDQVLNHGAQPTTIQRRISCLKSFRHYCHQENLIQSDFMAGITAPKSEKTIPTYMTLDELKKLFRFLEQDHCKFAVRNELMFKLLATTGMRRQEIIDLTWQQLDLSSNTIRVKGKGRKERLLPLHPIVLPLFPRYRLTLKAHQMHGTEVVFPNKNGVKMNPRGLHIVFKRILEQAGLPPARFSLHHLRHTFATLLLKDGNNKVDLRTLQELLGHESLSTTSVYTHIDLEQKIKAIRSFNLD